jgi:hypothetical protein
MEISSFESIVLTVERVWGKGSGLIDLPKEKTDESRPSD